MDQLSIAFGERITALLAFTGNPLVQLIFMPLLACLLICLTPLHRTRLIKLYALLGSGLTLLTALMLYTGAPALLLRLPQFAQYLPFNPAAGFQWIADFPWFQITIGEQQSFGVGFTLGADGLSLPLIIMSSAVIFLAVVWAMPRTERVRDFFALTMLLASGLLGVFVALDYILFYLCWELMLIPMYFLIAGWGHNREKAGPAAIKFFIYTIFGSVFMLVAFITMQVLSGEFSFNIITLTQSALVGGLAQVLPQYRLMMFLGLLIGFAVKVPMFPFHTWLPDAHTEAPPEMSVILAAVMLKTGSYAFLRILYPTFPDAAYTMGPVIAFCGLMAIVYGAAITLVQTDLKRLVAYSSISHMGFIVLGISAQNPSSTAGAVFQMVGHGIVISTLFFLTGVIERRYGTRDLRELAGMWTGARSYAAVLALAAFAGMGLPGLVGFIGEFLILKGVFYNNPNWATVQVGPVDGSLFFQIAAGVAVLGILTAAVYMINLLQRILPGEFKHGAPWQGMRATDAIALIPLGIAMIVLGLYPTPVLDLCSNYAYALWQTAMQF
jgi:NADH-quinone oxidoreductase subunit M